MARPKGEQSDNSFGSYGLDPEEDVKLQKELKEVDISAKQLVRSLLRRCLKYGIKEVLNDSPYAKK